MKATRKYYIRVRADYVGYYEIEAKDISEAEDKAFASLEQDMNDTVYPSTDFEEFDPIPDKYQSIGSDNQDIFIQEEKVWLKKIL